MRKDVHGENNKQRDLSGHNPLLSGHSYYFGDATIPLRTDLQPIIKRNQGHRVITKTDLVTKFESWIKQFKRNMIYADPHLHWEFDRMTTDDIVSKCSS